MDILMAEQFEDTFDFDPNINEDEEDFSMDDYTEDSIETSPEAETSLNLPEVREIGSDIRSIETQDAVNRFYKSITDLGWEIDKTAPLRHKALFGVSNLNKDLLAVKYEGKVYKLNSNKLPYQFLALSTIERNTSVSFIRDVLGLKIILKVQNQNRKSHHR